MVVFVATAEARNFKIFWDHNLMDSIEIRKQCLLPVEIVQALLSIVNR